MSMEVNQKVSPTAEVTPDVAGLGQTSGQRTAEIFAGLRAELMKTPEIIALSRFSGRLFARIIVALANAKILNFVTVRLNGFMGLTRDALQGRTDSPILVDTAAGFAPRGILLAKEMPHLKVIEVDLPGVVAEKHHPVPKAAIAMRLTGISPKISIFRGTFMNMMKPYIADISNNRQRQSGKFNLRLGERLRLGFSDMDIAQ